MEQSDLDLLQVVPPYHLQTLIKLRHMPLSSSAALPAIAEYLFTPAAITGAIKSLNDTETAILHELVACGGRANSRDLALYFASSKAFNGGKEGEAGIVSTHEHNAPLYPTPHPHGVFEQALHRLLMTGLLFWGKQTNFVGRDYTSGVYDGVLIVPQVVQDVFHSLIGQEQGSVQETEQPLEITEGLRAFQRVLYLYWSHVAGQREGLLVLNSGLLSRTALRQVIELLGPKGRVEQIRSEQDVPRLLFIRLLLRQLGLLQERKGAIHALAAEEFFALPLVERARRCYRLWLETPFWNELAYLPNVIVRPGPNPLEPAHAEVVRARHMLIERVLAEVPGTWLELPAFIARTKLYKPYLLFPRQYGPRAERYLLGSNPYNWDFRLRSGLLTHREGWHMVEGGFIRTVILGPLHWLGVVEVKIEGTLTTFCRSAAASLITAETPPVLAELSPGRLIVQPNFELVALAPVSEALLIQLDRFAERLGLEHIAQYRITKASITHAIQQGLDAATIQRILEEAAGDLPQNVQYSLAEWERQARRIELWLGATLLEVQDTALLDSLFADEEVQPLLGRRLSPTLVEVAPGQLPALQAILWRRNYLPALTAAPPLDNLLESTLPTTSEPQWHLHPDGLLQPLYAVTDLYLASACERISEPDAATGWRKVTAPAIQQALTDGLSLAAIIRFLQRYAQHGIPGSLLIRLKLWGHGYGSQPTVQVEHSPMLYVPAEVLQDIQADEELQGLLGTEVAQGGRLVRVERENLERVVEVLRERGFVVE